MMVWRQYRAFDGTVRLLLLNQLTINLGFYMLMPYLAMHLSGTLGLAAGVVGLILGVRNLAQQGMFVVGGALADRFGYRPLIIAGCALRTAGFAALGFTDTVSGLIAASAAVGFAGALFNPAVRAYLAQAAGPQRVEAFAAFNVFYQAGILIGPLIGVMLSAVDFRLTCAVAALVFAVLTLAQMRALPAVAPTPDSDVDNERGWRHVLGNHSFLAFAAAMAGSYVLAFQVYLALPLRVREVVADPDRATLVIGALFAVSGLVTIGMQARLTARLKRRWTPQKCLTVALAVMTASIMPLAATAQLTSPTVVIGALLVAAGGLALGTAIGYPFEMDTIVALSRRWRVATHYGVYSTITGLGIVAGNTGIGALISDRSPWPWLALLAIGACATAAVYALGRTGRLRASEPAVSPVKTAVKA